jgi:hypothetical protein
MSDDLVKRLRESVRESEVNYPEDHSYDARDILAAADRIEALEWDEEDMLARLVAATRIARREALEEAARVAETLGVDPQTNTNTDAYRHKRYIATAIRALKEDK